ncbi:MAG: KTSC domain-containing protein [Caulobacteraceae bacterium]
MDGGLYAYFDVAPEAYDAFRKSGSKGRHFARQVRDRYRYRKLDEAASFDTGAMRPAQDDEGGDAHKPSSW